MITPAVVPLCSPLARARGLPEVLNEIAALGLEPGPPDSPPGFYWQFEQLRALACILSAELALRALAAVAGDPPRGASAGGQS